MLTSFHQLGLGNRLTTHLIFLFVSITKLSKVVGGSRLQYRVTNPIPVKVNPRKSEINLGFQIILPMEELIKELGLELIDANLTKSEAIQLLVYGFIVE